ncbi:polar amino acid transport system substrate-binding protein [Marinospirillum celere]|uniref:Polar amino acid transport system substrate-binding protein n=1 Tax=Marinospirillum celere TaxID=1122252 RepID=A0A1I1J8C2_9GAMM|nr:ABC transporter substrate-binding protein [Marinospirillum celere]SFC44361.1 polar amino acid transport system substrate-binding protein [Marinospirillum celere]
MLKKGLLLITFAYSLIVLPVKAAPALQVLIMETEPWGFYDQQTGQPQGIWLDIARELEAASGIAQNKQLAPYARVMESLALGDTDISYLIQSADRDQDVIHAGHLFDFGSIIQARTGIPLNTYADLQGLRIGVLQGIRLSPEFDRDTSLYKIPVRNYETQIHMLAAGRLDAIAGNSLSLAYLQEQMQIEELLGDRLVLQVTPVTVQFSRHSEQLERVDEVKVAVENLNQQGRIEAILDSWAGDAWRVDKELE